MKHHVFLLQKRIACLLQKHAINTQHKCDNRQHITLYCHHLGGWKCMPDALEPGFTSTTPTHMYSISSFRKHGQHVYNQTSKSLQRGLDAKPEQRMHCVTSNNCVLPVLTREMQTACQEAKPFWFCAARASSETCR